MLKHNWTNTIIIAILLAIATRGLAQGEKNDGKIYAYVNNLPVFESAVVQEYRRFIPSFHGKKYRIPRESQESYLKKAIKVTLEKELVYQEATRQKLEVTEQELKSTIHIIEMKKQLWDGLEKYVQSQGRDYSEFILQLKRELLVSKFLQREITSKIKVEQQDLQNYYQKNKKMFYLPEQINIQLISVRVEPTWEKNKKKQAEKRMRTVYNLVKKGRDFYSMAETYSDDPWRVKGGEFGYKHHGQIEETIEKQALALKVEEISKIFQSDYGYHVVKLLGKKSARQLTFKEVQDKISSTLRQKNIQKRTIELYRKLELKYKIKPPNVRKIFFEQLELNAP